ncbi:type II toxin-antitoxin system VapC family toxin [Candidatus Thiosymbion oneisti]|uniref:type II toxin-antitoxin system VapC family toxin n=1 Tax=Candidatus Thiosymbion oneisti TaxID=589554 RepID=UPI001061BE87|nr:type II toxin-antitoxin system VapC family toxin [Candidatus Thiosymbion oneisti]
MESPFMIIPDTVFTEIRRLGFDTSPFIYFVERHPVYLPMIRDIIRRIDEGIIKGYGSVITLTEVLVYPRREGKISLENEYRDILQNSRNFELVPISAGVADQASELRSRHNLRTPDALQITAVLSVGCEAFLTNDKKLKHVDDLRIIVLDDYLPEIRKEKDIHFLT